MLRDGNLHPEPSTRRLASRGAGSSGPVASGGRISRGGGRASVPPRLEADLEKILDGLSLLEKHAVTKATLKTYAAAVLEFEQWRRKKTSLPASGPMRTEALSALDRDLALYLNHLAFDGESTQLGRNTLYGLIFI